MVIRLLHRSTEGKASIRSDRPIFQRDQALPVTIPTLVRAFDGFPTSRVLEDEPMYAIFGARKKSTLQVITRKTQWSTMSRCFYRRRLTRSWITYELLAKELLYVIILIFYSIGEIRDERSTAKMATRAALTGHSDLQPFTQRSDGAVKVGTSVKE